MINKKSLSRTCKLLVTLGALILGACSSHDKSSPALSFQSPQSSFELENYYSTGTYPLSVGSGNNLLAAEASGITFNKSTGTLFVIGDGGTSVVQVSKKGELIDSMELAPGDFADTEGISWVSGNQFVLVE